MLTDEHKINHVPEGEEKKLQERVARENHLGRDKSQRAGKETGDRSLK